MKLVVDLAESAIVYATFARGSVMEIWGERDASSVITKSGRPVPVLSEISRT